MPVPAMPTPENYYRGIGPGTDDSGYGAIPTANMGTASRVGRQKMQSPAQQPFHKITPGGGGGGGGAGSQSIETVPAVDNSSSVPVTQPSWSVPWWVWVSGGLALGLAAPPLVRWGYRAAKKKLGG